ncbi:hypothetical protein H671_8g18943 [Cricetulus griseus]|nr:hypothetical protein H671_8g18943 [Cricetulus griseus]
MLCPQGPEESVKSTGTGLTGSCEPQARISSTILTKYGESGQSCFVPDFRGIALSFSPFSLMLAVGLLYIAFLMFRYVPVVPVVSKIFIMKVDLNCLSLLGLILPVYMVDYIDEFSLC